MQYSMLSIYQHKCRVGFCNNLLFYQFYCLNPMFFNICRQKITKSTTISSVIDFVSYFKIYFEYQNSFY